MIPSNTSSADLQHAFPAGLIGRLPAIDPIEQLSSDPDYYGASSIIATQLGMPQALPTPTIWKHGWAFTPLSDYRQLTGEFVSRERLYLVRSEAEATFLQEDGFSSVAVGLPFLYALTAQPPPPRQSGSLLVMPIHGTTHTPVDSRSSLFQSTIAQWRGQFSYVVACISGMCVKNNQWIEQFEANGIPWITGAWVFDRNALLRLKSILGSFEYVLTNSFGSHILYAAAAGCKVVCLPEESLTNNWAELAAKEPIYIKHPELLQKALEYFPDYSTWQTYLATTYPVFFQGFEGARTCTDWARKELGEDVQRSPSQLAGLLQWEPQRILEQKLGRTPLNQVKLGLNPFSEDMIGDLLRDADHLQRDCAQRLEEARTAFNQQNNQDSERLLNHIKAQRLPCRGVDQLRALLADRRGDRRAARLALQEEVAQFPDNAEARRLLRRWHPQPPGAIDARNEDQVLERCAWHSELSSEHLRNLLVLLQESCASLPEGRVVECGVGHGGSAALLAWALRRNSGIHREVNCFDSFEGYPAAELEVPGCEEGTASFQPSSVIRLATELGANRHLRVIPGEFKDTVPLWIPYLEPIAFLHINAGLYQSTKIVLNGLSNHVMAGGIVCISDYQQRIRVQRIVDDYRASLTFTPVLRSLAGGAGACFQIPRS